MEGIAYAESFQLRRQAGTASGGTGAVSSFSTL